MRSPEGQDVPKVAQGYPRPLKMPVTQRGPARTECDLGQSFWRASWR